MTLDLFALSTGWSCRVAGGGGGVAFVLVWGCVLEVSVSGPAVSGALGDPEGSLGLGVLLSLGSSGVSGRGAFCFVGNGSVLQGILAGVREWHLISCWTLVTACRPTCHPSGNS